MALRSRIRTIARVGAVGARVGAAAGGDDPYRPLPRGAATRAQAVQRLQVGFSGLAAMLLLVALANVIMQQARKVETREAMPAAGASATPANDPLADIGVVPDMPSDEPVLRDLPAEDVPRLDGSPTPR